MNDPQLRQLKDFMEVYNRIAETCFNHCITSFADRKTSDEEATCADRCVKKYIGLNHHLMQVYVEVQPEIVQRRIDEMSKLQEAVEKDNSM